MTLERADISVEDLHETRDRSLVEAYEPHDIGEDYLTARLEADGYDVVEHGDDARHADEVFYGDGPDLLVEYEGEPLGYIEVKTKEDPEWFGRCNLRHFREYVNHANEVDVPVFIWFAYLDTESEQIHREAFIQVTGEEQVDGDLYDVGEERIVMYGQDVTELPDSELVTIDGSDIVEVESSDTIVEYIPDVFGNEVVCLDDAEFRNFDHVRRRFDEQYDGHVDDTLDVGDIEDDDTSSDDYEVDERIWEVVEATTPAVTQLRRLLADQLVVNPAYPDIVQIRTNRGRMGAEVDEESELSFAIDSDGSVEVWVETTPVTLGTLD